MTRKSEDAYLVSPSLPRDRDVRKTHLIPYQRKQSSLPEPRRFLGRVKKKLGVTRGQHCLKAKVNSLCKKMEKISLD